MSESNEFKRAKNILAGHSAEEKRHEKFIKRVCDWDNPDDVNDWRNDERDKERSEIIDRLAPKRICRCGRGPIVENSGWILSRINSLVICRSCFHLLQRERMDDDPRDIPSESEHFGIVHPEPSRSFLLDGAEIIRFREEYGITQKEFAIRFGWSQSSQYAMESGDRRFMDAELSQMVLDVITEIGGDQDKWRPLIFKGELLRWRMFRLAVARRHILYTRGRFADKMGWSLAYQARLETNDNIFITDDVLQRMKEIINHELHR